MVGLNILTDKKTPANIGFKQAGQDIEAMGSKSILCFSFGRPITLGIRIKFVH
jgi:hypothetical protein